MSVLSRAMEGCVVCEVPIVDIGTLLEQQLDGSFMTPLSRSVQSRHSRKIFEIYQVTWVSCKCSPRSIA